ncbi:unnamed protein product, partial [Ixodes hexagonus]
FFFIRIIFFAGKAVPGARDGFELPEESFRRRYRLSKNVLRWLCDELREEPEVRRLRTLWTVMTVELQVLCALRFYATGAYQGSVATDETVRRDQATVSVTVRSVSIAIVRCLAIQRGWIRFPQTPSERNGVARGFRLLGRIPGVIGCIDGTMISIIAPPKTDTTVTTAAYWCRKQFYALNVLMVCDAKCQVLCIDPRYPGSVHDSFAWQFSWLRDNFEQGWLIDDGQFLLVARPWSLGSSPLSLDSMACGRFNKAHSSMRSVVESCIRLLKNRFRCLQRNRTLYYHPTVATAIITACAVLHNICLESWEPEPEADSDSGPPELESEPSSDGSESSSERSGSDHERLAPAHLPVSLSDRGKALRLRLVAQFQSRPSRAVPERHARHGGSSAHQGRRRHQGVRPRHNGSPVHQGLCRRQGAPRH